MILVSRSGRNPTVYIPPIAPPHQPISSYFLAVDILRARERRLAAEQRTRAFLEANPRYQNLCECRHRQFAHDEDGGGRCLARKCDCGRFQDTGAAW